MAADPNQDGLTAACLNCGSVVPAGEFCGACGAHLPHHEVSAGRHHAFAAHPGEPVLRLAVVSTLLPHLSHHRAEPFRIALIGTAGLLVVLGFAGLTAPAIGLAACALPLMYLVFLYEAEIYEDQPAQVIGLTVVVGLVAGIPWGWFAGPLVTDQLIQNDTQGYSPLRLLLVGAGLPLAGQALMLVGPMLMRLWGRFDEALDGFTFGAAGALGFGISATLVELWPEIQAGLVSPAPITSNALSLIERGVLMPIMHMGTTGLVAGAIWLHTGRTRPGTPHVWITTPAAASVVAATVQALAGVVAVAAVNITIAVAIHAGLVVVLLLWVRVALHHTLLAEAVDTTVGGLGACSHCRRMVPRMAFCPSCGIATRATPKAGAGRLDRGDRQLWR